MQIRSEGLFTTSLPLVIFLKLGFPAFEWVRMEQATEAYHLDAPSCPATMGVLSLLCKTRLCLSKFTGFLLNRFDQRPLPISGTHRRKHNTAVPAIQKQGEEAA